MKMFYLYALAILSTANLSSQFNGMAIDQAVYDYICGILEPGKTILELGSGSGTGELAKHYKMYSIEHDERWVNKYESTYIHAPIVDGWYSLEAIRKGIPTVYDLILIDGPLGSIGRYPFLTNISLFNTNVPLIFDDVHREVELKLLVDTSAFLNRPYVIYPDANSHGAFGVILPK